MNPAEYLPLVGLVLVFYLLIIRPSSKRRKEFLHTQSEITAGAEVMLTSGIYGTISAVDDENVKVDIAPGVTITVVRQAIGKVMTRDDDAPEGPILNGEA